MDTVELDVERNETEREPNNLLTKGGGAALRVRLFFDSCELPVLKTIMGRIICVLCRTTAAEPSFGPAVLPRANAHIG